MTMSPTTTGTAPSPGLGITAQQLADILPSAMAIIDPTDHPILVNRRFTENATLDSPTAFSAWSSSIHPDDLPRVTSAYHSSLRTATYLRTEYRRADTHNPWRALVLSPLTQPFLSSLSLEQGFICTIADITIEKRSELAQKEIAREAQARKAQQEKFIDMISHEVRNPLSAVLHCTEDILEAVKSSQSHHKEEDGDSVTMRITQAAETIGLCVAHQKKIIDDVLMFSKLDASMLSLMPRAVQPTRHLGASLTIFRPELRRHGIVFEYKVDHSYLNSGIEWVMADIDRMGQVLINLMSNAIKYTRLAEGQRKISVFMGASRVRPPSYPPNVVFFESSAASRGLDETGKSEWGEGSVAYVMVAVRDTGIGISDLHQKRLFERFTQATPRTDHIYGGFGLGLNVSQRLCHMHGGEIGVSSKEGCGSTFGFFFTVRRCTEGVVPDEEPEICNGTPMDQMCRGIQHLGNEIKGVNGRTKTPEVPESPPVTHIPEVAPDAASDMRKEHSKQLLREVQEEQEEREQTVRVLLVEDNIINQQVMSRRMRMSGFEVTEASNGQEALRVYKPGAFDCILMDQQMPVMDGMTATRAIRTMEETMGSPRVPVLGVTANVRQEQRDEMLQAGMDDIIHKPYKMRDLCQKVREVVGQSPWQTEETLASRGTVV